MRRIRASVTMLTLVAIIGLLTAVGVGACATCGCALSTDWPSIEYFFKPGLKLDVRYDYLNQDQLWRSGKNFFRCREPDRE